MTLRRPATMLLILTLPAVVLAAGADGAESRQVPRTDVAIEVDGVLDEEAWARALVIDLPFEVDPGDNPPAPVRTEALVTYDGDNLFIGFRAFDPDPSQIRAHLSDRDTLGNDDWVGVTLDTFNDERRDYLFLVNPYGVQLDRIEIASADSVGWDGIWESAGRIHEWGWAAELRIPFAQLTMLPRGDVSWGQVQVVIVGVDKEGNQSDLSQQKVPVQLATEKLEEARQKGYYAYRFTLELEGGTTSIRLAVNDALAHTTSTVLADVKL